MWKTISYKLPVIITLVSFFRKEPVARQPHQKRQVEPLLDVVKVKLRLHAYQEEFIVQKFAVIE